jgi:hypothetical protein
MTCSVGRMLEDLEENSNNNVQIIDRYHQYNLEAAENSTAQQAVHV